MDLYDLITANFSAPKSFKDEAGKEWLIAPVVMIVPGVLTSNHGSVLYNEENLSANPTIWDGTPLIENHPKVGSTFVSIHSDEKFVNMIYGEVKSTTFNGKLQAEAWIDVEKAEKVASATLGKVRRGEPIEVSTGIKSKRTPEFGTYNMVAYTAVASNFEPDHLATLPEGVGACSLDDGCGMNVNESKKVMNELLKALKLDMVRRNVPDEIIANELSHWQIQMELNEALSARFTQDEPYAYVDDVFDDFFVYSQKGDQYKLSYKKTDTGVVIGDETPARVVSKREYVPVSEPTSNQETNSMCKQASIKTLIANGFAKPGDEKLLEAFDEKRLEEMVVTSNQAKADRAVAEAVLAGKSNPTAPVAPVAPVAPITGNAAPVPANMTTEQWLELAPPGYAEAMNEAIQWQTQQRAAIASQLTAHVADQNVRKALTDSLALKSLKELRELQLLVPAAQPSAHQQPVQRVSFFGQPGIPSVHQNQKIEEDDILDTPRINWRDMATAN